jgi:hypothetical protein
MNELRTKHGICYECRKRCEGRGVMPWRQVIVRDRSYEFCGEQCQEIYLDNLRRVTELPDRDIDTLKAFAASRSATVRSSRGPHALVRFGVLAPIEGDYYRWTQQGLALAKRMTGMRPSPRVFRYRMSVVS